MTTNNRTNTSLPLPSTDPLILAWIRITYHMRQTGRQPDTEAMVSDLTQNLHKTIMAWFDDLVSLDPSPDLDSEIPYHDVLRDLPEPIRNYAVEVLEQMSKESMERQVRARPRVSEHFELT